MVDEVEDERTDGQRRGLVRVVLGRPVAQGHPQPGLELAHAEGLGHVVVGAAVEGGDLAVLGPVGRQHDDGHGAPLPDAAADLEAVHVGQAEVEDDDVGRPHGGLRRSPGCRWRR